MFAISSANLQKWTNRDPILAEVNCFNQLDGKFSLYQTRSQELSVVDGWGARVVVPPQGRQAVLDELILDIAR